MSELYDPRLVDHGKNPRNRGPLADPDREARADNPLCGDRITVALTLDGDRIRAIRFEGRGCVVALGSASLLTTLVEGRTLAEVDQLQAALRAAVDPDGGSVEGELAALSGVRAAPSRRRCATLAWEALDQALSGR